MENEQEKEIQIEVPQEEKEQATTSKHVQPFLTTPVAIVIAGVLIMGGIFLTKGSSGAAVAPKEKTLSEQVGVSKDKLTACIKDTDTNTLNQKIAVSVESAMKALKPEQKGTPYSIVVGKNGLKTEIFGADSYANVKKAIDEVNAGKVTVKYGGDVPAVTAEDHLFGNPDAPVTIIEYSDFECPYCARFHPTLEQVVAESNGSVNWVYRHWPIHNTIEKLVAAECVAKIKGNDAFWKYADLLFKLIAPVEAPVVNNNL